MISGMFKINKARVMLQKCHRNNDRTTNAEKSECLLVASAILFSRFASENHSGFEAASYCGN